MRFSKFINFAKRVGARFPGLEAYAKGLARSVRKLGILLREIVFETIKFVTNLFLLIWLVLWRGIQILFRRIFDIIKAFLRIIVEAAAWPLEHIIYPAVHWLSETTDKIIQLVQERDNIALLLFFTFIVLCCLLSWVAVQII